MFWVFTVMFTIFGCSGKGARTYALGLKFSRCNLFLLWSRTRGIQTENIGNVHVCFVLILCDYWRSFLTLFFESFHLPTS